MQDNETKAWDISVRLFHWSLVIAFIIAYITEDDLEQIHAWAGYVVLGLVIYRLLWGLVGTKYARFSNFIYSPARVLRYLGSLFGPKPEHYTGHNPAGGYMVIALLLSLFATSWTGMLAYADEGKGPLANTELQLIPAAHANGDDDKDEHDNEGDEFWEDIHEFFADFTLLLIFIHVVAVIGTGFLHNENLVRAMVTGRKKKHD